MRNLLLFTALLVVSTSVSAQLYVTPNTSTTTDSYIYVNDEVLFVEQDINLVENTYTPTTKASIYLRQEAQLVQGATATPYLNSGTGLISVFQNTPNDDSWDYSFWGSPVGRVVGSPAAGNINFGILAVHDSITLTNSNQTLITAAYNGIEDPLTISRRWIYKKPGEDFIRINSGDLVDPGLGFIMKGVGTTNHNQIYDFRGRPNNGTISVPITTLNGGTITGNPYPSALDMNRFYWDPENTEFDEIYYWDEKRDVPSHLYEDNKGGYGTWTPGATDPNGFLPGAYTVAPFLDYDHGGTPTGGQSGGSGGVYQRRFAPIGQGFLILNNGLGDGTIYYRNSQRRYIPEGAANNSQYRNFEPFSTSAENPSGGGEPTTTDYRTPHLRIHTTFNGEYYRDMILFLDPSATDEFDRGLDAKHPKVVDSDAYFPFEREVNQPYPLVMQGVNYDLEKQVPFGIKLAEQMRLKIKVVEEVNINNVNAYIWDSVEDSYQQITGSHTAGFILPAGDYTDRFFIVFQNLRTPSNATTQRELTETVRNSIQLFQNNPAAQMEIRNPEAYDIIAANVFDMSGKMVVSKKDLGTVDYFSFSTATLSDGVYLVKLTTSDNIIVDYKVTVYNKN